jgi:hypothetical protein
MVSETTLLERNRVEYRSFHAGPVSSSADATELILWEISKLSKRGGFGDASGEGESSPKMEDHGVGLVMM